jgi:hypothetical protein
LVLISGLDYKLDRYLYLLKIYIYNKTEIDRLLDVIEIYYGSTINTKHLVKDDLDGFFNEHL